MPAPRVNPYDPRNPVNPRHFAGRKAEIAEIRNLLQAARDGFPSSIFIKGAWGIGKTSLINKLLPEFSEHSRIIREDVATGPQPVQIKAFYPALFQELVDEMDFDIDFDIGMSYNQPRLIRKRLVKLFSALWEKSELLVIVILDNLERADPKFLADLKDVFQRVREEAPHFMLVFAGKSLPGTGEHASDPVARFFEPIQVGPMNEEESLEAIHKPLKFVPDFRIEHEAAVLIANRADGHPYFLKRICYDVFKIADGEGTVDSAWLDDHWGEIETSLADAKFFKEYEGLPEAEQSTLLRGSVMGSEFKRSDIQDLKSLDTSLRRLKERDLIRSISRGVYAFYHPLFQTFVRGVAAAAGISAPNPTHTLANRLIEAGEGPKIEFKETMLFNTRSGLKDKKLSAAVLRAIAAFHNTGGGQLLIGVADDGTVMGLDRDIKLLPHKNRDGFTLHLLNLIRGNLKPMPDYHATVRFESVSGKDVCIVSVPASDNLTYIDDVLYRREGPQSITITDASERERIIKNHGHV
jgi:hypothetical protein